MPTKQPPDYKTHLKAVLAYIDLTVTNITDMQMHMDTDTSDTYGHLDEALIRLSEAQDSVRRAYDALS